MADVYNAATRSAVMARVRSRGNRSTEEKLAALLRAAGLTGWRRRSKLFGAPDFVWSRERVALFVDGCFWHRCPRHGEVPASRLEYWEAKLDRNVRRDRLVRRTLQSKGWTVIRVWECALTRTRQAATISRIRKAILLARHDRRFKSPRAARAKPPPPARTAPPAPVASRP